MPSTIKIKVVSGSLFCIKVVCALEYKNLPYEMIGLSPLKLKKSLPPPHQVPVMIYNDQAIADSQKILKFLDAHHSPPDHPSFYPPITGGIGAAYRRSWASVEGLENYAHDHLSMLCYYFASISKAGQKQTTEPFLKAALPKPLVSVLPIVPAIGACLAAHSLRGRVAAYLGEDAISSDEAAESVLKLALHDLEASFQSEGQLYFFATDGPTAADFGVFCALKRLVDSLPDAGVGIAAAFPGLFEKCGEFPRLEQFFKNMNERFYKGRVDWSSSNV